MGAQVYVWVKRKGYAKGEKSMCGLGVGRTSTQGGLF